MTMIATILSLDATFLFTNKKVSRFHVYKLCKINATFFNLWSIVAKL